MKFTIYVVATGKILGVVDVPAPEDALINAEAGASVVEGDWPESEYYINDGAATPKPYMPPHTVSGRLVSWPFAPAGFVVKITDAEYGDYTVLETLLSDPNCELYFHDAGLYDLELTAAFPYRVETFRLRFN